MEQTSCDNNKTFWQQVIERFVQVYSMWLIPAIVALLTGFSLFSFLAEIERPDDQHLELHVVEERAPISFMQARDALNQTPAVAKYSTNRSENAFWFSFPNPAHAQEKVIELNSRHALDVACWRADTELELGSGSRLSANNLVSKVNAWFAITLAPSDESFNILCKGHFSGPAKITATAWDSAAFDKAVNASARRAGLLDGGLGVLAAFVLIMGIINKETLYVVFFSWIIVNLRMASMSSGWDVQWLGQTLPPDLLTLSRKLTLASYHVTFIVFFGALFKSSLAKLKSTTLLQINQWTCPPLLLGAFILPYAYFLPLLWVLASYNACVLLFYTCRLLKLELNRTVLWFTASFAVTVGTALYEIIFAAFNAYFQSPAWSVYSMNTATAALFSCFLASLAIAEQMRKAKLERQEAISNLAQTYDHSPVGLFTCNKSFGLLRTNQFFDTMLHSSTGLAWLARFDAKTWGEIRNTLTRENAVEHEIEYSDTLPDGSTETKWFLIKMSAFDRKIEGSIQNITERVLATQKLSFIAKYDGLTGALNRHGVTEALRQLRRQLESGVPVSVAYFDIDRFKVINDLYGQKAGDGVLNEIHMRMRKYLQQHHVIGRLGAAEFLLVLSHDSFEDAHTACAAILSDVVSQPFNVGDKTFRIRASIGMVEMWPELTDEEALSAADQACRQSLTSGRFDIVKYQKESPVFKERAASRELMEKLESGDVPEGLFLVMQPIMSVRNPFSTLNFEVLLRKRQADGSIASAWSIISTAERNGRIALIDRWVLSNALAWIETNYDHLITRTKFICVNLSGGSLNDERFTEDAFAMLAQYPRAAKLVCLEVTESVAINDLSNIQRFIDKAKTFGACIAIDDFGAGFSSFSYLKDLPANVLKIDGSFVRGAATNLGDMAIVSAISGLAGSFGMQCVAEWAEDLPTIKAMTELQVDYLQGFALAKPMLPEEILQANSSADFITDPETLAFVRSLENK